MSGRAPSGQALAVPAGPVSRPSPTGFDPSREGCAICTDEGGEQWLPHYGVAPHECFWRKGPEFTVGQSTLVPFTEADCFVPDLEEDEDWSAFKYPSACGVYYCPNCNRAEYEAAWERLVARIGQPPALAGEAGTAATVKQGAVHEHATAKPERPNMGLIVAVSLSVAVVSALWIVGGVL